MAERKNFNTSKVARMSQAFPQAVIADKFIFVSGTPGLDLHSGQVISDSFEDQTRQCFENIKVILEEAGSRISNVVKTTIFMEHWQNDVTSLISLCLQAFDRVRYRRFYRLVTYRQQGYRNR